MVADSEACSFELIVPDSVKKIKKNAFSTIGDCITRIKIGVNVAYIGECAFGESHKKISSIDVSEKNKHFKVNSYYDYTPPAYDPNIPNPHNILSDDEE